MLASFGRCGAIILEYPDPHHDRGEKHEANARAESECAATAQRRSRVWRHEYGGELRRASGASGTVGSGAGGASHSAASPGGASHGGASSGGAATTPGAGAPPAGGSFSTSLSPSTPLKDLTPDQLAQWCSDLETFAQTSLTDVTSDYLCKVLALVDAAQQTSDADSQQRCNSGLAQCTPQSPPSCAAAHSSDLPGNRRGRKHLRQRHRCGLHRR